MLQLNWNEHKSILLSRILVFIFAIAVAVLDIGNVFLCVMHSYRVHTILSAWNDCPLYALTACNLLCSPFAYRLLWHMHRLLRSLQAEQVFTAQNVAHLRSVSHCCFAACLICLLFGLYLPQLLVVTLPAGFVGLIVRIVKNVMENAIVMKDELDFTV